jgi:hypothetical protein
MASLAERWAVLLGSVRRGSPPSSVWYPVPADHVLRPGGQGGPGGQAPPGVPFRANEHYFVVRVHQAHLADPRKWFVRYDPMLLAVTEYNAEGTQQREPFLVGPSTFQTDGHPTPAGMNFTDVRATEVRPYRGGTVSVTMVLYQNKVSDVVRKLLSIAERCVALPGLSETAGPYVKYAEAGLDALESVLGLDDTVPLLGALHGFDSLDGFGPGWYVLCQSGALALDQLWVRENRLYLGPDPEHLTPADGGDFVLFSLGQTAAWDNADGQAEFQRIWRVVMNYANKASDESWDVAKAMMTSLADAVYASPDLIFSQAEAMVGHYTDLMVQLHRQALARIPLAPPPPETDPLLARLAAIMAS